MSKISVLVHDFDNFRFPGVFGISRSKYLLHDLAHLLRKRGHHVSVCKGISKLRPADMVIAHVDCTRVPDGFVEAVKNYPVVINGNVTDINKRSFSKLIVDSTSDWSGPVMVKSALNYSGYPEVWHNEKARKLGKPLPHPEILPTENYSQFDSIDDVPVENWKDENLIIEKFLPERVDGGYATRYYVFCGKYERCTLHISSKSVVKGKDIYKSEPVAVPEEIRRIRHEMGFDYGKFDFIMHEGKPYLLDANKTLGKAERNKHLGPMIDTQNAAMVEAIEEMLL